MRLTPAPKSVVTISFLGYTNDAGGRRKLVHSVPDGSAQAMAMFQIENHGRCPLFYDEGHIELKRGNQWRPDPARVPWTDGMCLIGASNSATILLPTPTNQGPLRCRLVLWEIDTSSVLGIVRNAAADAGIAPRKRYKVFGPEVVK
jgi:hypothetical protein